jgi:cellulase/cellobiase CelA1
MAIAMFTRRARYAACAVAAVLVVAGVGAALALPSSPGKATKPTAAVAYCGLVACAVLHSRPTATATVPAGDPSPAPRSRPVSARRPAPTPTPTPVPASTPPTTPAATPKPSPAPAPTSTGVAVTVTYSVAQHWPDGFQGELTIVNHGRAAVTGWQLVIALPGDQVDTVWNAGWHQGGDIVTMTAASYDQMIEPGASQSVNFVAKGNTTNPVNCTFDGSACR